MTGLVEREVEKNTLLELLDRAAAGGTVMLLLEGPAGVGKTALVEDFRGALPADVLFAGGVFDEAAQHVPYSGIQQALRGLLRSILAQTSHEVAAWRLRLQKALGPHGPVIASVFPEVEWLLGPQSALAQLAPEEQRQQLHDAAGALMVGFGGAGAPLVLFLDNLHWSGQPTFDLLPYLVAPRPGQTLLVIGAMRDGPAGAHGALEDALGRIAGAGVELHRMALEPLRADAVAVLAAERVGDESGRLQGLGSWLHRQTGGNPLHIGELLTALQQAGVLKAPGDAPGASWRWDPAGVALSDDLAGLLARHLRGLPPDAQAALTTGAHLGASFTLDDLAHVEEVEPAAMAEVLAPAVEDGILAPADADGRPIAAVEVSLPVTYRFRHDRIAEAAAALTPEADRAALHLRIGRALLRTGSPEGGRVLEAAAHLNAGSELMIDPVERVQLAELNLAAGRIRRSAAAFADAWWSFACGLGLLPSGAWQSHYDLMRDLHVEAAAVAPIVGQPVAPLAGPVLAHARAPLDAVEAHRSLILAAAARGEFDEALHLGNRALAALGERPLPLRPSRLEVLASFARTRLMLRGKSMSELRNAPRMTDPQAIAVERILSAMLEAFQVQYRDLAMAMAVFRIVGRTQTLGRSPLSAYGYMAYAALLVESTGNTGAAVEYGRLALELAEADGVPWVQSRVQLIWLATLSHRVQSLSETLDPLRQVSWRALAMGDVTTGIIAALIYAQHSTTALGHYGTLLDELRRMSEVVAWRGFDALRLDYVMELQFLQNLMRPSADPTLLTGDYWDESVLQDHLDQHDNTAFLGSYHTLKAVLAYQYHDYARALEHADAGRDGLDRFAGLHAYPASLAIDSLIRLAMAPLVSGDQRRRLIRQVSANQREMSKLVGQMPANVEHFHLFVEAEHARVSGRTDQANALFQQVIGLCQERHFTVEEASSSEAFGRMLLHQGEAGEARRRLSRSRDLYRQVGALGKVAQMNRVYAQWLDPEPAAEPQDGALPVESAAISLDRPAGPGAALLLRAATEAIARETTPDALIARLMATVLTHTEATRAVLLSHRPGAPSAVEFAFEAECARDGACITLEPAPFTGEESDVGPAPARVLNFTANTAEPLTIGDARKEHPFAGDPYVRARETRAVLCLPLRRHGALIGLLYLENDRQPGVFGEADVPLLTLVATQAVYAVESARFDERDAIRSRPAPDGAAPAPGPLEEMTRRLGAGDWSGAAASFDEGLDRAASAGDPALWRALSLGLPPELMAGPDGLARLASLRRGSEALVQPDDAAWQRARLQHAAMEAWLRGRLADVVAIGHSAEGGPGEGGVRLFDPPCLSAAAHTARREYDAARACLDLALSHPPAGGAGRDARLGLAVRRARLYWLLGALPRLETLLRDMEADPDRMASPMAPALISALRGILALEQGDPSGAERELSEAVMASARAPAATLLARPDLHLARLYEATGRHEQAEALVDAALAEVRRSGAPGLLALEGAAVIPLLRAAAQRGREGPAAARVLAVVGVSNVTRRLWIPEQDLALSPREVDVLEMLAADAGNRAIAERLGVEVITVKSHITRVLAKLGVSSRHEAAARARALGLGPDNVP
jgi:predicted ATPase/DNA-binding CsgD family transcriptional regulator